MVVSQLQPSGIVNETIMDTYRAVPREMFVPNTLRGVCYMDDDIQLADGRVLMEPLIHARMVQDADIHGSDKVLDIGGGSGYSAAILAKLAGQVVALDQDEKLLQSGPQHWAELGLTNISPIIGNHADGYAQGGPYQLILVNGAVGQVPENLIGQLADGGRLYFVLRPDREIGTGRLIVLMREASGQILQKDLGDASTAYLKGFEPSQAFAF